jgi:hypothetical protein
MNSLTKMRNISLWLVLGAMVTVLFGCAGMGGDGGTKVTLSGAQEVPPVTTNATGSGTIVIGADKSVSGSVTTSGVAGIAAHIHMGAVGKNGPVIVPMTKTSDNEWTIQAGAKLTDEQYASFKAGDLYVNVHSAANKGGEIRGQLKP